MECGYTVRIITIEANESSILTSLADSQHN